MGKTVTITKIPHARLLLKGEWDSPTYLIDTECDSRDGHCKTVDEEVESIIREFNQKNHASVSLREVKRELVYAEEVYAERFATLVQFRVRDAG